MYYETIIPITHLKKSSFVEITREKNFDSVWGSLVTGIRGHMCIDFFFTGDNSVSH